VKHQTISTVSFKALSKRLGLPLWQTVGLLESLTLFCLHNCRDGVLSAFSELEISAWLEYDEDEVGVLDALMQTGWVQRGDDGVLRLRDWDDNKPNWLKGIGSPNHPGNRSKLSHIPRPEPSRAASTAACMEAASKPGSTLGDKPGAVPPNLTQPNPTQPSSSSEVEASAWRQVEDEVVDVRGCIVGREKLATARAAGASPADIRELLAEFDKRRAGWDSPAGALAKRIERWHPGQAPTAGWPAATPRRREGSFIPAPKLEPRTDDERRRATEVSRNAAAARMAVNGHASATLPD
jgi:hypothetical protein